MFSDRLTIETAIDRDRFLSQPLICHVFSGGATQSMYVDFLTQAYHHVKHTFALLALAASRTTDMDYQQALLAYMNEERGHDAWILNDIEAITESRAIAPPSLSCQAMVGYAYYAIEHISPYAMLGSVHVLEGISVTLANQAAHSIKKTLGRSDDSGFSYLLSHGALDIQHVKFFEHLINKITKVENQNIIINSSKIFYKLYGDMFREIGDQHLEIRSGA